MIEVPSTEFVKHFGRYKELAQGESVAITSHGRTSGYLVSERDYAEYQRLKAGARRAYGVGELPDNTASALVQARMSQAHDHLNTLVDD